MVSTWFIGSPLIDAFHQYDLGVARRALEEKSPTPAPEETMSSQSTAAATSAGTYVPPVPSQPTAFGRLQAAHQELAAMVGQLSTELGELQRQVTELIEQGSKAKPRDDMNDRIIAYLRDSVPGVWMTPTAVGVNLDLDPKSVSGRLNRLSHATTTTGIERKGGKGSGSDPLYRVVPLSQPQTES